MEGETGGAERRERGKREERGERREKGEKEEGGGEGRRATMIVIDYC